MEHLQYPNVIGCWAFPDILDLEEDINKTKEWTNSNSQNEGVKFSRLFMAAQDMTTLCCVDYPQKVRYLMGENLEVVWAKFSILS